MKLTRLDKLIDHAVSLKQEKKEIEAAYDRVCEEITLELQAAGVKSCVTPNGNKFSVSEIDPQYGVKAEIYHQLEDYGVEWWEVFKEADKEKIDALLRANRIPGEIVLANLFTKTKGYTRKYASKASQLELNEVLADRTKFSGD